MTLEDVAVAAYNGQAGNLTKDALRAAATVISVDARHTAWIRSTRAQTLALVRSTRFVVGHPRTSSGGARASQAEEPRGRAGR